MPTLILSEEVVTTTPNRQDMEAIARSAALGRLARLGVDTAKLGYQMWSVEFFAAKSRGYEAVQPNQANIALCGGRNNSVAPAITIQIRRG